MPPFRHSRQPSVTAALTARRLGTWPVFVLAVSAMTPLTVVAGALPLGYGQVRETGIPVAYVAVAAMLGIFAVGLSAMARHLPNSGAFYAYVTAGIGRPAGVATAFVALLAYNLMQIGLYGAFGVTAAAAMDVFGVHAYWGAWVLLGWLAVAGLGLLRIRMNARLLAVLVCAEVVVVVWFDAVMIAHPADGVVSAATLDPALLASPGGVALLVGAVAGFVGFESPLVYAAQTKDPRRTVARAVALTVLLACVLYGGSAWAMSVSAGPDRIVAVAADHPTDLFFHLPAPFVGGAVLDVAAVLFMTSLFAAMLAFHHTVARYTLTLAREGVLPRFLARTRDDEVPVAGSMAQSALALVVLIGYASAGLDPTTDLFFAGTVAGGLGVLLLMTVASVAVLRFFARWPSGESVWRRLVAPAIAVAFLLPVSVATVAFFGDLLGSTDPVRVWAAPVAYLTVGVAGAVWGTVLRFRHRTVRSVDDDDGRTAVPGPAARAGHR